MELILRNKGLTAGLMIVAVTFLFFGYFTQAQVEPPAESNSVGADLISLSQQLTRANLSTAVFSAPEYLFLTDFSSPIPEEPLGRINPFEALGR